jgi:MFS family permease
VLAVVSAAQFLIILDLWVVNIALPALQRDFAPAALPDVAWILDAYAIVLAALLVPHYRVADRTGRRPPSWPAWRCSASRRSAARWPRTWRR